MDMLKTRRRGEAGGSLEGQLLVAMPGMPDERFRDAVIYICAHGADGAMGFIINQAQPLGFGDILVQLGIVEEEEVIRLPEKARSVVVRNGGPVDRSRGFVIHSRDYFVDSSHALSDGICVTATLDILRAMSRGIGPRSSMLALGYSGWGPGQLEEEIRQNGWLTCPLKDSGLLFADDMGATYRSAMAMMGIDPAYLSAEHGHA